MNKKVLKMILVLTIAFLSAVYVAKIFFPEWFVLTITNENIIAFGNYVDTHTWAHILATLIMGFITYSIYCCACCGKLRLNWKENLIILGTVGISILIEYFLPSINLHYSICSMFILPLIFKAEFKPTVITYTIHGLAQILSLGIRDIGLMMPSLDFASFLILSIDMYIWLIALYLFYNIKDKKEKKDEN